MTIQVLEDKDENKIMYCSATMWAFGSVFYHDENAYNFIDWAENHKNTKIRLLKDAELSALILKWRMINTEISAGISYKPNEIDPKFLEKLEDVEIEDVDKEDYPKFVDAFLAKASYKGVWLTDEQCNDVGGWSPQWMNEQAHQAFI